ncbi:MAG: hypothetical protein PHR11_01255 [Candidatus Omnitrophica bacterium]|nr:hypothetical protein [Candidatus Omnitrophota bacterium]
MSSLKNLGFGAVVLAVAGLFMVSAFAAEDVILEEESASEANLLWIWGEVASVDPSKSQIAVRYLDYETDMEKEMLVAVDTKTIYENVVSLEEIKPLDSVSIDYILGADGQNLAKAVSVEKPQDIYEEKPQDLNPPAALE